MVLFYGFSQRLAAGVSNALTLRMALVQIRQQLNAEVPRLAPLLEAAQQTMGPMPPSASSLIPTNRPTGTR